MYQKISPSFALCVGPVANAGTLPFPCAFAPWHPEQFLLNNACPASTSFAEAFGFAWEAAVAGAPWNPAVCAEAE